MPRRRQILRPDLEAKPPTKFCFHITALELYGVGMLTQPEAKHISLAYCPDLVTVRAKGILLAETQAAMILTESGYAPRFYIPKADVLMKHLQPSDKTSICPHKGRAVYFHAGSDADRLENIAWSYPAAKLSVAEISGMIAFYEEKLVVSID